MRISFTGHRYGYNLKQEEDLRAFLTKNRQRIVLASHGCCIGSDIKFHRLVREVCGRAVYIAAFPSNNDKTRAPIPDDCDYVAPQKPPLARNADIVDCGSDLLLATPDRMFQVQRSGTWSAIRYAMKKKVSVEIFYPQ